MPGPSGSDDGFEIRVFCAKFQSLARCGGVGNQVSRIADAAWLNDMGHLVAGFGRNSRQNLAHRKPSASAKIKSTARMSLHQQFQRKHVRRRQIGDVNVITDRRAVGRVVIVAEYREVQT